MTLPVACTPACSFMERLTLPQKAQFFYLKLKIDISKEVDETPVEIDIVTFKSILIQALDSLHGKVGSAIGVDIIKFEASSMEAILRVKESGLVKLWSALTLLSYYKDRRCAIYVIQVSPYLLSLAADSRQWKIKEKEVTT
ncbi:ribonuclease P protein subunit p14-like [Pocillopora verrucosa]|uniref:ribonuclease P protein subunit p14-like n=1 Tax=Pocillopora verrucosa TaxID=203993 RepID=UPI0027974803|nr:ribonuclease P protein subunit p14-like [Pocillopora verrucosa]